MRSVSARSHLPIPCVRFGLITFLFASKQMRTTFFCWCHCQIWWMILSIKVVCGSGSTCPWESRIWICWSWYVANPSLEFWLQDQYPVSMMMQCASFPSISMKDHQPMPEGSWLESFANAVHFPSNAVHVLPGW